MTTDSKETLPEWDMTPFFPSLASEEFKIELDAVVRDIHALVAEFDLLQIGGNQPGTGNRTTAPETFDKIVASLNATLDRMRIVGAYISSFVSTDSRNGDAQSAMSSYQSATIPVSTLMTRFSAWLGSIDPETLISSSRQASAHAFMVHKAVEEAKHLMSPAEEELASELSLSGSRAWSRLHGDVSSQIVVSVPGTGEIPMSAARNLAYDPDRAIRATAYVAELDAWERNKIATAAAFNGIKGDVTTLCRRRKWSSPLEESLFENHIDSSVLGAMMSAARRSFPDFRRYLNAKAKLLNVNQLAWYDLFAPIASETRTWLWKDAENFVEETFGTYSDRLKGYAKRSFEERWIDAASRPGKADGAFCMRVRGDESRILTNFKPSFNGVSTLAHELGHGYHNLNLAERTYLQRDTPMTLAETASIFCETIIRTAGLAQAESTEKLSILEASLQGSCQIVVDISSRFLFEEEVFKRRSTRALRPEELCEIMLSSQAETYGDAISSDMRHAYMWAVKPHYYSTSSFYNYPYMFGQLFGLGLYSIYENDPESFKKDYDNLLSSTGLADARTLANRFGIDISTESFWESSLDILRRDIGLFEEEVQTAIK